jgi:hypothetical protein
MDALLFQRFYFVSVSGQQVQFKRLEERVAVLRSELNCKVEIVLSLRIAEVPVARVRRKG